MSENKKIDWKIHEVIGEPVINGLLLLPEEESRKRMEAVEEERRRLEEEGTEPEEGEEFVCPNGCEGEFRTHGTVQTMLGWFDGPDPNRFTQSCSCLTCGARFTKHWVPAENDGKPWFIVGDTWEERRVYSGECQCGCPEE